MDFQSHIAKLVLMVSEPEEFVETIASRSRSGTGLEFFAVCTLGGAVVAAALMLCQAWLFGAPGAGALSGGVIPLIPIAGATAYAMLMAAVGAMLLAFSYFLLTTLFGQHSTMALSSRLGFHIAGLGALLYQPAAMLEDSGGGYLIVAGGAYLCYLLGRASTQLNDVNPTRAWIIIAILTAAHTRLAFRTGAIDISDFYTRSSDKQAPAALVANGKPIFKPAPAVNRQRAMEKLSPAQKRWLAEGRDRALQDLRKGDFEKALVETEHSLAYFPQGYYDILAIKRHALNALAKSGRGAARAPASTRPRRR